MPIGIAINEGTMKGTSEYLQSNFKDWLYQQRMIKI